MRFAIASALGFAATVGAQGLGFANVAEYQRLGSSAQETYVAGVLDAILWGDEVQRQRRSGRALRPTDGAYCAGGANSHQQATPGNQHERFYEQFPSGLKRRVTMPVGGCGMIDLPGVQGRSSREGRHEESQAGAARRRHRSGC